MGMDVYGINPSTEDGDYFRANRVHWGKVSILYRPRACSAVYNLPPQLWWIQDLLEGISCGQEIVLSWA